MTYAQIKILQLVLHPAILSSKTLRFKIQIQENTCCIPLLQLHTGHKFPPLSVLSVYPFGHVFMQCTASGHARSNIIKSGSLVVVGGGGVRAEKTKSLQKPHCAFHLFKT